MLEIKKLEKSFEGIKAVKRCSFTVGKNEIVALIGPNGAGKTTVFNLITGFIRPDDGDIHLNGVSLSLLRPHEIAQAGIARTFQLIRLFPQLTIMENLLLAQHQDGENFYNNLFRVKYVKQEEEIKRKKCLELLGIVGMEKRANDLADNLSYGQRKLVEIARTLATESDLILLDEPVAGVNPVMRKKIKEILLKLKKEGKTILFIEHDMKFVMDLADKVVVMDHGREIAEGKPGQIQKNPKVLEAYLGKKVRL